MFTKSGSLLLAASLMAAPLGAALAQSNPTGNLGSNKSTTAAPRTADSKSKSGLNTATPGVYTKGSTGTRSGATGATHMEKKGAVGKE